LSSQSLQVSWQPPPIYHTNGLLQGYKLVFEPIIDDIQPSKDEVESRKTTALTMVLTGLRKYTNYSIQVLAHTRMGDGVVSKPLFCHSEEDVPEAPADIKVVSSSSQSLYISWLPPNEPNGVITKYGSKCSQPGADRSHGATATRRTSPKSLRQTSILHRAAHQLGGSVAGTATW